MESTSRRITGTLVAVAEKTQLQEDGSKNFEPYKVSITVCEFPSLPDGYHVFNCQVGLLMSLEMGQVYVFEYNDALKWVSKVSLLGHENHGDVA